MAKPTNKSRGLGRGLSALMADVTPETASADASTSRRADMFVPIENIYPNPDQPRRAFDDTALNELAQSIAEKGIIQPLIVRKHHTKTNAYEIVAGERRWRASQIAKLHQAPVVIRDYSDTEVLEVAIIENIQRADLNPIDEAAGYRQLMDKFGHTQDQLAVALGKSRSHIANHVRLLSLPSSVVSYLETGQLSAGHARALVGHDDATKLADHIVARGLSVRDTEKLAKTGLAPKQSRKATRQSQEKDADTKMIESELSAALRMRVAIDHDTSGEGGKMTINYKTLEQLDDLLRALSGG